MSHDWDWLYGIRKDNAEYGSSWSRLTLETEGRGEVVETFPASCELHVSSIGRLELGRDFTLTKGACLSQGSNN